MKSGVVEAAAAAEELPPLPFLRVLLPVVTVVASTAAAAAAAAAAATSISSVGALPRGGASIHTAECPQARTHATPHSDRPPVTFTRLIGQGNATGTRSYESTSERAPLPFIVRVPFGITRTVKNSPFPREKAAGLECASPHHTMAAPFSAGIVVAAAGVKAVAAEEGTAVEGSTAAAAEGSTAAATPAAVAGYPHLTVPAGFVLGLPVGLSFFGRAWSEPLLLKLGYAFEQATGKRREPRFLPTIKPEG